MKRWRGWQNILDKERGRTEHPQKFKFDSFENRQRFDFGNQTLRGGFHGQELVVRSFDWISFGGRLCGDYLEFPSGRPDRLQSFHRTAYAPVFCDLSRPTTPGDIAPLPPGRGFDEDLWNLRPQPQQHLAKLPQPPSQSQLQAPRFS